MEELTWLDQFVRLPLEKLVPADWNYKDDDEFKAKQLKENIIVRELETGFYEVVNGNHRLPVFKELNYHEVMCFNLGIVSQQQAIL